MQTRMLFALFSCHLAQVLDGELQPQAHGSEHRQPIGHGQPADASSGPNCTHRPSIRAPGAPMEIEAEVDRRAKAETAAEVAKAVKAAKADAKAQAATAAAALKKANQIAVREKEAKEKVVWQRERQKAELGKVQRGRRKTNSQRRKRLLVTGSTCIQTPETQVQQVQAWQQRWERLRRTTRAHMGNMGMGNGMGMGTQHYDTPKLVGEGMALGG